VRRAARSGLAALALALATCGALAPAAATAASPSATVGFHLQRGHYRVDVGNFGETVFISVETGDVKSGRHVAATNYVAHGTATESRLEASFGPLGELSMRFRPAANRTWEKPDRNCRGLGKFMVRKGTWVGTLRFRGEGGYLDLDVHRVKGSVETIAPKCRAAGRAVHLIRPSQESSLGREVPVLQARWRHGVRAAEFIGGSGREGSNFYAATEESHGRIAIFRTAHAEGKGSAVRADDALTRADLSPPAPFHGSGHYRAAADGSTRWDGGLYVSFPGAAHYTLTGEPFEPSLELFPELLVGLIGVLSADQKQPAPPSQSPPSAFAIRERSSPLAR
jgi:hypothetical protein